MKARMLFAVVGTVFSVPASSQVYTPTGPGQIYTVCGGTTCIVYACGNVGSSSGCVEIRRYQRSKQTR